jgi:hypothetical protein
LALALCSTIIALPLQADEQHVWRASLLVNQLT